MLNAIAMRTAPNIWSILALASFRITGQHSLSAASVEGALKVWQPVTITFTGKEASETETTFRDHRLDVTFTHGDKSFRVPGYFAADGNAAETSAPQRQQVASKVHSECGRRVEIFRFLPRGAGDCGTSGQQSDGRKISRPA
jgi:hypothetical protein